MGILSQPLKRTVGSFIRPETPKFIKGFYNRDEGGPLSPLNEDEAFSFDCNKAKKYSLSQRCWYILKNPQRSLSKTVPSSLALSALESDTDRSMSPVEEWNNESDDVNLLPTRKKPFIESVMYPSDGEGFDVMSSSSSTALHVHTAGDDFLMQRPPVTKGGSMPQTLWSRVSASKARNNKCWNQERSVSCNRKKKSKKEIEIQFECFFEDEEDSHNEKVPLPSADINIESTNPIHVRHSTVLHSWLTKTVDVVRRGCTTPAKSQKVKKSTQPHRTNSTEPADDYDDESQIQITFETMDNDFSKCISSKGQFESRNLDVNGTVTFSHNWDTVAPIQFLIPNDSVGSSSSWDFDEDCHFEFSNHGAMENTSNPVLAPIV